MATKIFCLSLSIAVSVVSLLTVSPSPMDNSVIGIEWDESTLTLVRRGGVYARMIRLQNGEILCGYDVGGKVHVSRSRDNGKTWGDETFVCAASFGGAANTEILQLQNGWILLSFNERPMDKVHPFTIKTCISKDNGYTWSPPSLVYEADVLFENGCWEPAQIQLSSGEVQLFFANENPYRNSAEQEITLVRSYDNGLTWMPPETVSFRKGHRDGMPVPLVLRNGKGVVLAIEDSGLNGNFKPAIVHTSLKTNWREPPVDGNSPRRWSALTTPLPADVYAGAPYIRQLPGGETVLSCQSAEGGRQQPQIVVYIGDENAKNFAHKSAPFKLAPDTPGLWNSLFVKDDNTVTAISGTIINGIAGIWAIDGRVVRHKPKKLPMSETAGLFPVTDYGAIGDGVHDDTEAFRKAVAGAAKVGGYVTVPPVQPGGGYVLTGTVRLEAGVSLLGAPAGMPFIAWEGVPREMQRGAVILARPREEDYKGEKKRPLFELGGGNTVRGIYVLYDQQPWPSDKDLESPDAPYRYPNFEQFRSRFVADHAKPYGPTFYSRHAASCTLEDITCGRYYDFCVFDVAGKVFIERCYLYGYKRAFAFKHAPDTVRIRGIHLVPNVERPISREHTKLHAAITACDDNVLFDFGVVDGYSVEDVVAFLVNTGFKLGATKTAPFYNPVDNTREGFDWGRAPWGSIQNVKLDNVVIGFRCVNGTILPNQLQNVMVHVSIPSTQKVETTTGNVARQAAFFIEPGFAGATLSVHNLAVSSFAPTNVLAGAQMMHQANGRMFLIDCPGFPDKLDYAERKQAYIEIFGLVLSNVPRSHLIAVTAKTSPNVWVRGFTHNGVRQPDGELRAQ